MKTFGLLALAVVILGGICFTSGCTSASPEEMVAKFKESVKPGMTWQQVVAAMPPKEWSVITPEGGMGQQLKFVESEFASGVAGMTSGFIFVYRFSPEQTYHVLFDGAGKVEQDGIEKQRTVNDMLNSTGMGR